MRRNAGVALGIAAMAIAIGVLWRCRSGPSDRSDTSGSGSTAGSSGGVHRRVDPRKLARGSISGTIRDDQGAPIAKARACADWESPELSAQLTRDPICVVADERGTYTIPNLLAARYWVEGMAPGYAPAAYRVGGKHGDSAFALAAGEHRTGVDLVLPGGAVEITGTVSDVSGGPIARARVWGTYASRSRIHGRSSYVTETDDQGRFSVWLLPGDAEVAAVADGYARAQEQVAAPGTVDLRLIPESSIAGTVIDAVTGEPRPGVRVGARSTDFGRASDDGALTDEAGRFRIDRLAPSRYALEARSANGYGRGEGSTLVGLAQHVDGVVIKLHPAYRIEAQILVAETKQPCREAQFFLTRDDRVLGSTGGDHLVIEGLVPGSYRVSIECMGHHAGVEPPQQITIVDRDVTGLVWEVFEGATLHGFVRTQTGAPVPDAEIIAAAVAPATGGGHTRTDDRGELTMTGLRAGEHTILVISSAGVGPKQLVSVTAGKTVETQIVLEAGGALTGSVVDHRGKPRARVFVHAMVDEGTFGRPYMAITRDDGTFHLSGLAAGGYSVVAWRAAEVLRKPGSTDDDASAERVTVEAGRTSTVRLVVEETSGTIRGSVSDADGKPIDDAWVIGARESDAAGSTGGASAMTYWIDDSSPTLTSVDGTFELRDLTPGKYTLRAFRRGGGDAIVEHVPVGSTTRLQIKPTASIEGTIRLSTGVPPGDFSVTVFARSLGMFRRESLFRTAGRYAVRDLPAGTFDVQVTASAGRGSFVVTLASGEHKSGADFALEALVTVTGRVVELGSHTPVPGAQLFAMMPFGGPAMAALDNSVVTDASGRFTMHGVAVGRITIFVMSNVAGIELTRTIPPTATGTFELGELAVVKPRLKPGERAGRLGVRVDRGDAVDKVEVAWIDPAGPAAKTELRVGDRVVSVDGIDVSGDHAGRFDALVTAPPNTTISLGLARNATVKIVLAAP